MWILVVRWHQRQYNDQMLVCDVVLKKYEYQIKYKKKIEFYKNADAAKASDGLCIFNWAVQSGSGNDLPGVSKARNRLLPLETGRLNVFSINSLYTVYDLHRVGTVSRHPPAAMRLHSRIVAELAECTTSPQVAESRSSHCDTFSFTPLALRGQRAALAAQSHLDTETFSIGMRRWIVTKLYKLCSNKVNTPRSHRLTQSWELNAKYKRPLSNV